MDIMRHKDAVDDIVKTGKALLNSKSADEKKILMVILFLLPIPNTGFSKLLHRS